MNPRQKWHRTVGPVLGVDGQRSRRQDAQRSRLMGGWSQLSTGKGAALPRQQRLLECTLGGIGALFR